ncbi:site-specific DNA-methyltransferase [Agrococcus sp. SGAir0287]|uniref:site-specific DNA-methyltransferase n=1 Tax=Agrococcus sp. SGAir0287 TaxID=2070347 RepID=UPI0010CD579A|nr:DNA methyltransferase [Agrococcus sp. SGAir0287]QCR20277.1 site-specific DNA-methyltransferase [Agrococcus sp. SGAir0287]
MSRLNDLLRRLDQTDAALAKDLRREVEALTDRRAFGLNFERHAPEAVELPGRPVRRGDKVRVLPPRGSKIGSGDQRLWRVTGFARTDDDARSAKLELLGNEAETSDALVDDLVVVAEFRDPIYPGLVSTGKVERGGDKPYHAVINAENYHALQTLLFTHRGKVDAIYIDPPYNTGAKDWKYNNDYVEGEDLYRHSKWLAFMERRLKLAKDLLNPDDSVLIVTIDEKEYLRLGLLLEQVFPAAEIQMVTTVIAPQGSARGRLFKRSEEYIFCVFVGESAVSALPLGQEWGGAGTTVRGTIHWASLKRTGTGARREDREGMFYPVLLSEDGTQFVDAGTSPGKGVPRASVEFPPHLTPVWPIRTDGSEGRWQVGPETLRDLFKRGFARLGKPNGSETAVAYLKSGEQAKVGKEYAVVGHRADGSIVTDDAPTEAKFRATTVWTLGRHSAGHHGSNLLRQLLPGRTFPFPKSLYAVEDTLRFFVAEKPNATIVDFFCGSGTTAHAVMRLNKQDGGERRAISITNNEVAAEDQRALRDAGLRPGDETWERSGICEAITKPRVASAITGRTPDGVPVRGDYKFTDEFPMTDGLLENVEFFTLTYEAPLSVSSHREFARIAPLLWLRAGSRGRRIDDVTAGWDVAEFYGVLADLNHSEAFIEALAASETARMVFIVTDEDRLFESTVRELPEGVEPVRLYEAYLQNFEIETSRSAL